MQTINQALNKRIIAVPSPKHHAGFTLIELMIVTAIIGILVSIALPAYDLYRNRGRFSEAVLAIGAYRSAVLVTAHTGRVSAVTDLDAGTNGIPPTIPQAANTHGITVVDGAITVTWQADGTDLAGTTYSITAQGVVPPIQWVTGGTCIDGGYC